jgi:hypothetical protein
METSNPCGLNAMRFEGLQKSVGNVLDTVSAGSAYQLLQKISHGDLA